MPDPYSDQRSKNQHKQEQGSDRRVRDVTPPGPHGGRGRRDPDSHRGRRRGHSGSGRGRRGWPSPPPAPPSRSDSSRRRLLRRRVVAHWPSPGGGGGLSGEGVKGGGLSGFKPSMLFRRGPGPQCTWCRSRGVLRLENVGPQLATLSIRKFYLYFYILRK